MKKVLTTVVPAIDGCNLKCAGCVIEQSGEAKNILMQDEDYLKFFGSAFKVEEVAAFSIQGYEALLPSVYPLSSKLLEMSYAAGLYTSLVTNGVYLSEVADKIVRVTDSIVVSVDSHDPVVHDLSRGKVGAWAKTVAGIKTVRNYFGDTPKGREAFGEYITVASILYPGKVNRLIGMPKLLSELGISKWGVTPLISRKKGGYHDADTYRVRDNLLSLTEQAARYGVKVTLDDALRKIESVDDMYRSLSVDSLDRDAVITRLSPDGSFAVGQEIMSTASAVWDRQVDPANFLDRSVEIYLSSQPQTLV